MESFIVSSFAVAVAEIGDKTQLLAFLLAARFQRPWPIIWGIIAATLVNHAAAAGIGAWAASWLTPLWLSWTVGLAFIAVGVWVLVPDQLEEEESRFFQYGAFTATLITFFLAEMGDKTQIATIVLAAQYDAMFWVVMGSTLGMLSANAPVVLMGHLAADKLPLRWIRGLAAATFIGLGVMTLLDQGAMLQLGP